MNKTLALVIISAMNLSVSLIADSQQAQNPLPSNNMATTGLGIPMGTNIRREEIQEDADEARNQRNNNNQ